MVHWICRYCQIGQRIPYSGDYECSVMKEQLDEALAVRKMTCKLRELEEQERDNPKLKSLFG